MEKRFGKRLVFSIGAFQAMLLVSSLFAFSFLINEAEMVSSTNHLQTGVYTNPLTKERYYVVGKGDFGTAVYSAPTGQPFSPLEISQRQSYFDVVNEYDKVGLDNLLKNFHSQSDLSTVGAPAATPGVANLPINSDGYIEFRVPKEWGKTPKEIADAAAKGVKETLARVGGKTFNFGGKEVAMSDFISNPAKYEALGANGQLTPEAIAALEAGKFEGTATVINGKIVSSQVSTPLGWLGGTGYFFADHLLTGVFYCAAVYLGIQMVGGLLGLDQPLTNAISNAALGGVIAGKAIFGLQTAEGTFLGLPANTAAIGGGIIVAAVIFILTYSDESKQVVRFECLPWEPPLGGASCEKCNNDPFRPCSEYRCKALGQACELLNPGTGKEKCAWVNPKDTTSPVITPWESVLTAGHKYTNVKTRPPSLGMEVERNDQKCLRAFTPLQFGINTSEPAKCKIDYFHKNTFDEMEFYFGDSNYYEYGHIQKMRLPAPGVLSAPSAPASSSNTSGITGKAIDANANGTSSSGASANGTGTSKSGTTTIGSVGAPSSGGPVIGADGTMNLYVRCMDANGNYNVDEYAIRFCIDKAPDVAPPTIEGFSIPSGSAVRYKINESNIDVYINEPAECKWSRQSKDFAQMENPMSCLSKTYQVNANLFYTCSGKLTGIKDREDNKYYFRCKDTAGNIDTVSKELVLRGSQPLNILKFSPNNATITESTTTVPVEVTVETGNGADNGKAICELSSSGLTGSYVRLFETNSFKHKQRLDLPAGNYNYYLKCTDSGNNAEINTTSFVVSIDQEAPKVTRAYKSEGLKIVTDEDADCYYSQTGCNYNITEGTRMSNPSIGARTSHFIDWRPNAVYNIKCTDKYGNEPDPNKCSITVSAVDIEG